jgi:hypothetical protein
VRSRLLPAIFLAAAALPGCISNTGESLPAPSGLQPLVGDGVAGITWNQVPGVSYFVFGSTNPSLTADNWTDPTIHGFALNNQGTTATSPALICSTPLAPGSVANGQDYYFVITAHSGSSPGGPSSPATKATPRAAGKFWSIGTPVGAAINGAGYVQTTGCTSAAAQTGRYVAVGPVGAIFTGIDAKSWTQQTPVGFAANLNAVTGRLATGSTAVTPVLDLVAVGDNGAAVTSADGLAWTISRAANQAIPNLNSITLSGLNFIAVGDNGRIDVSPDGKAWVQQPSPTTSSLRSVHCAPATGVLFTCIAVGDNGVILTSNDKGGTWTAQTINGQPSLKSVVYGNFDNNVNGGVIGVGGSTAINTWVAVGDSGTLLVNNNGSWQSQSIGTSANLKAVTYTSQFVVLDASGNVYLSQTGLGSWTGPIPTSVAAASTITTDSRGLLVFGSSGGNAASF